MPTGDELEAGHGTSANDPTVVLASVDEDGNNGFLLGRGVFEAGPTDVPAEVPQAPFIGLVGRGSHGRHVSNPTASMPPMPGVFGFGGKPSGPDGDRQGGSGVLGVGGTADYDFPVPLENDLAPGPGVYGIGGVHFNTGVNGAGVVGASGGVSLSGPVPQLPPFQETRDTGVVGMAAQGTGVKGMAGTDGAGVVGVASATTPPLASQLLRVGVLGVSDVGDGVRGYSRGGPGVDGYSEGNRGGVLGSSRAPQLRLVPANIASPTQLGVRAEAGDLLVTVSVDERGSRIASLWFCTVEGTSTQANWVKLA